VNEYDLARVGIVRALVYRGLENYGGGIHRARESTKQFRVYGDLRRHASARMAEVNLLLSCCEYEQAYSALIVLKNEVLRSGDTATYARVVGNLGYCCWKMARLDEALQYFDGAAQILEEVGNHSNAVRTRWNAARVLAGEGRFDDALPRLTAVVNELERLGMMASATEASLELAEILVTAEEFDEVEEICKIAIRRFEVSSLTYTAPALTALALMHEAIKNRTATRKFVVHVREYLRRIPDEPHLLFAFPQE
jgi:tetratricopeptide (TPR) repeat protein